eukprot:gb/GFBE01067590.1/.p1 GENE.gb/GFBE01067590.1/~~gb/GFBE01067590.1/.p1  ORF type:complete len:471 (+),score=101.93 gb/GFBE01067590.1/:1-1413(+)
MLPERLALSASTLDQIRGARVPIGAGSSVGRSLAPFAGAPGCYQIAPGSISIEPWAHKPNLNQRNEAERVKRREEAFQARRRELLQAKEAELEKALQEKRKQEEQHAFFRKDQADTSLGGKSEPKAGAAALPPSKKVSSSSSSSSEERPPRKAEKSPADALAMQQIKESTMAGMQIKISASTASRAQAADVGARPKAAMKLTGRLAEERRQRQLEERKRAEYQKMQEEAKQRLVDAWKNEEDQEEEEREAETQGDEGPSAGATKAVGRTVFERSRSRDEGEKGKKSAAQKATTDPYLLLEEEPARLDDCTVKAVALDRRRDRGVADDCVPEEGVAEDEYSYYSEEEEPEQSKRTAKTPVQRSAQKDRQQRVEESKDQGARRRGKEVRKDSQPRGRGKARNGVSGSPPPQKPRGRKKTSDGDSGSPPAQKPRGRRKARNSDSCSPPLQKPGGRGKARDSDSCSPPPQKRRR